MRRLAVIFSLLFVLIVGETFIENYCPQLLFSDKFLFERLFEMPYPSNYKKIIVHDHPIWNQQTPRFRFYIKEKQYKELSVQLTRLGYSEVKEWGGQFGSFNEDSYPDNPLLFRKKQIGKKSLMFYYRISTGILDAICFYN